VAVLVVLLSFVHGAQQVVMYADLGSRGSTWMHHLKSLREGLSDAWPDLVNFVLSGLSWATFLGGQARSWKARRCLIRMMKHGARILLGQNDLLQRTAQVLVGMSWLYSSPAAAFSWPPLSSSTASIDGWRRGASRL
jgi:hypothetical protein